MQYPQIQFYRGSLVRLASGKLKQVEDLSSDDFLESARLIQSNNGNNNNDNHNKTGSIKPDMNNNNNSVFNSPEQTQGFDSPASMELDGHGQQSDYDDRVTIHNHDRCFDDDDDEEQDDDVDDDDVELDVVSAEPTSRCKRNGRKTSNNTKNPNQRLNDDLYIDSSVVRDFLEVGPPSSTSPTSSVGSHSSLINQHHHNSNDHLTSTSSSLPPTAILPFNSHHHHNLISQMNPTVLIKFFLESSRSIVFIEVPIEHPFFVFHRGWSSWNPQRTYDKFGLKCRKLKIGDTCISLIRRQSSACVKQEHLKQRQHHDNNSDQCNILLSSIRINE